MLSDFAKCCKEYAVPFRVDFKLGRTFALIAGANLQGSPVHLALTGRGWRTCNPGLRFSGLCYEIHTL